MSFAKGQWNHACISRTGSHIALFYNGLRIAHNGSYTSNYQILTGDTYAFLGHTGNGTEGFVGYITDARFINGSHPNDASEEILTVPTERLTAVTNTKFLMGGIPYLHDQSSSNHSLTLSGTVNKEPFTPYDYNLYNATNHGGSALFDGTGDYLSATSSTNFNMGSGDFTAECWFYAIDSDLSIAGSQCILTTADSTDFQGIYFGIQNNNTYFLISDGSGSSWDGVYAGSATLYPNQWYHLACLLYTSPSPRDRG